MLQKASGSAGDAADVTRVGRSFRRRRAAAEPAEVIAS